MKFAYVYSEMTAFNPKYPSCLWQLILANYLEFDEFKELVDVIEISTITPELVDKYSVICVHFLAVFPMIVKKQYDNYCDIIKKCKHVCLLANDLHPYTFVDDIALIPRLSSYFAEISARADNPNIKPSKSLEENKELASYNNYDDLKKLLDKLGAQTIISPVDCPELKRIVEIIKCRAYVLWMPMDTKIFYHYHTNRDIDIFVYGICLTNVYPLRYRIRKIVSKMKVKHHIIWEREYPNTFDKNLANLLNRSWITICTTSVYKYLVKKYFEAAACGSVVAGNMCEQGKEIWGDNYIDIPNNATDAEIKNILSKALKNKKRLRMMGDYMSEKIIKHYNLHEYSKKVLHICREINGDNDQTRTK